MSSVHPILRATHKEYVTIPVEDARLWLGLGFNVIYVTPGLGEFGWATMKRELDFQTGRVVRRRDEGIPS